MNTKPLRGLTLSAAIAAALLSATAHAQQTAAPASSSTAAPATAAPVSAAPAGSSTQNKNPTALQQVVVTGNAANGGIKKIDASYSVTSMSAQQIKEANPKSAADLLKASPGIFPESSGGQAGANIEIAGFPGGGDAPYVTFALNGSPLYPMSTLSFMDNSSMFRIPDDTVERAEIVQGGPGVLYGNGQPGATANFILKEGTETPSGDIGFTYGSEGMERLDGWVGFKVSNNWVGSIGGWYRRSDGVRDPQYPADNGGSLTATLTRNWDAGSLMFYARALKDHNQFVADTPTLNPSPGNFSSYPGFDALTGTFGSSADQRETIQVAPCGTPGCTPTSQEVNMAKGRGSDIHMFGANFDWDFGNGWSLSDKLNFTGGQMNTYGLINGGENPESLGDFITGQETADGVSTASTINAHYTTGAAASLSTQVMPVDIWSVHKRIAAISNEFHISKELFDGNTLTVGNYTAVYNDHDTWYLGNEMLLPASNNPTPIVVSLNDGTNTYALTDSQGIAGGTQTAMQERWNGFNTAFFLSDSWKLDNWLFDGGIRWERQQASGGIQNTATGDLDDNALTLYNNDAQYFAPGMSYINYRKSAPSWTLGANYEFTPEMSAYIRLNDGVHFPGFDDLRGDPSTPVEKIHNQEIGFKYQGSWVLIDASAYHRLFYGVPYSYIAPDGADISLVYGTNTKGLNLTTTFKPFQNMTVTLSGDYMDGHYTNTGLEEYTTQDGAAAFASMYGKVLQRQPRVQFRLIPAYTLPTSWGSVRGWLTYEYVGSRYGDLIEQQPLGDYYDLSFGVTADIGPHWEYSVSGTNMTNQIGITEGNARLFGFASSNGVILARSIEGREVQGQIKYNF